MKINRLQRSIFRPAREFLQLRDESLETPNDSSAAISKMRVGELCARKNSGHYTNTRVVPHETATIDVPSLSHLVDFGPYPFLLNEGVPAFPALHDS
jgi:hypothetical protein